MEGKERDMYLGRFRALFRHCVRRRWPRLNDNQLQLAWLRLVEHRSIKDIVHDSHKCRSTIEGRDAAVRRMIGGAGIQESAIELFAEMGKLLSPFIAALGLDGLDPADSDLDSSLHA